MWNRWSTLVGVLGNGSDSTTPPVRKWSSAPSRAPRTSRKSRAADRAPAESRRMSDPPKAAGPLRGRGGRRPYKSILHAPRTPPDSPRPLEGRPSQVEVRGSVAVVVRGIRRFGVEGDVPAVPGNIGTERLSVQLGVVRGDGEPFRDAGPIRVVMKEDVFRGRAVRVAVHEAGRRRLPGHQAAVSGEAGEVAAVARL